MTDTQMVDQAPFDHSHKKGEAMTSDNGNPVDLYIAAYSDPDAAQTDWNDIKGLASDGTIKVEGLVLVRRDANGKIDVEDNAHTVGHGAAWGAGAGALIGLIFPPALLASALIGAGVGAGVGGLVSHSEKTEIKDEVEDDVPPDSSAIVALFEERWEAEIEKALPKADKVSKHQVDKESADKAKAGATSA